MTTLTAQHTEIRPAIGRVVVELLETEEVSNAGLFLPFGKEKISTAGQIVGVSAPYENERTGEQGPAYQLGDIVIFGKYVGAEVEIGRRKVIVMRETDIIASLHTPALALVTKEE